VSVDRVFLIGYRGSGKTCVARLLAERLGWQWVDADAVLEERAGRSIREIFATDGEAAFRHLEAELLADLCRRNHHVIATGGGVVLRTENRRLLRELGQVVWLQAPASELWQRIQRDAATAERRPPLTVGGLAEVESLLRAREPLYAETAHLSVDTTGRAPADIVDAILQAAGGLASSEC
jgi:shikimate kinase